MNNKAITPVISTILLIMLVVAITGGAWYWMTNVQGSLQESAGSSIEQNTVASSAQFSIVSTRCNSTSDLLTVVILNTGQSSITAASTAQWLSTVSTIGGATLTTVANSTAGLIAAGSSGTIIFDIATASMAADSSYSIRLNKGSTSQTATCTAAD